MRLHPTRTSSPGTFYPDVVRHSTAAYYRPIVSDHTDPMIGTTNTAPSPNTATLIATEARWYRARAACACGPQCGACYEHRGCVECASRIRITAARHV